MKLGCKGAKGISRLEKVGAGGHGEKEPEKAELETTMLGEESPAGFLAVSSDLQGLRF